MRKRLPPFRFLVLLVLVLLMAVMQVLLVLALRVVLKAVLVVRHVLVATQTFHLPQSRMRLLRLYRSR